MREPLTRTELMAAIEAGAAPFQKREGLTREQAIARYATSSEQGLRLYERYRTARAQTPVRAQATLSGSDRAFARLLERAADSLGKALGTMSEAERADAIAEFVETDEGRQLRAAYDAAREAEDEDATKAG